jgi:ribosomal-protein-alanine N-acetyltransferase
LIILALEASLGPTQVAVCDGPQVLAFQHFDDPNGAAEQLLPMVDAALTAAAVTSTKVSAIAVTTGPGRFTSLRIALAAARGLAVAWDVPVIGLPSAEVVAAAEPDGHMAVVLPVGRGEVSVQIFNHGKAEGPARCGPWPEIGASLDPGMRLIGPGAPSGSAGPDARVLARLAALRLSDPSPGPALPLYARPPDAVAKSGAVSGKAYAPSAEETKILEAASTLHGRCFEEKWTAESLSQLVGSPGVTLLILGDHLAPEAMGLVRYTLDEAEILTICVDPARRQLGLGRKLMMGLSGIARTNGAKKVFVEVREDNIHANSLYISLGFTQVSRRVGYYKNANRASVDALVLVNEIY